VFTTNRSRDYCVKIIAGDLTPGQEYFYRFRSGETTSPIGRTRTLPEGRVDALRFAIVSCANWQHGYFNTYDAIAKQSETNPFDAMIHLGDYYYEYGALDTPRVADRIHEPSHEIIGMYAPIFTGIFGLDILPI